MILQFSQIFFTDDRTFIALLRLLVPVRYSTLGQIVRRHFHRYPVTDKDLDEVLAHLAGNVRQHFVPIRQRHAEHSARQHLRH